MTDSQNNEPDIEDREANIRMTVQSIVDRGHERIYEELDRLHRRNIHDQDVMKALRSLGFVDVADGYEDWADIEREREDNTTTNPVVPDPADAPSYAGLAEQLAAAKAAASPALSTPALDRFIQHARGEVK